MSITAQVFFGLWLIPIGYLTNKSGLFPKWLGALLIVGGICYLVDLLTAFLVPDFAQKTHAFVVIPCAVAEISMVVYLLVVGCAPQSRSSAPRPHHECDSSSPFAVSWHTASHPI
jgi:hypothetical protein